MKRPPQTELIRSVASLHDLDPLLVEAVVIKESSGNTHAWNPEPHYRYFWNVKTNTPFRKVTPLEIANQYPPKDFPTLAGDRDQEWWGQQASWGLLQVMGAVARERGCRAPYLPALCNPELGLTFGCKHLAHILSRIPDEAIDKRYVVLSIYNAGQASSPMGQVYAASVLAIYDQLTKL